MDFNKSNNLSKDDSLFLDSKKSILFDKIFEENFNGIHFNSINHNIIYNFNNNKDFEYKNSESNDFKTNIQDEIDIDKILNNDSKEINNNSKEKKYFIKNINDNDCYTIKLNNNSIKKLEISSFDFLNINKNKGKKFSLSIKNKESEEISLLNNINNTQLNEISNNSNNLYSLYNNQDSNDGENINMINEYPEFLFLYPNYGTNIISGVDKNQKIYSYKIDLSQVSIKDSIIINNFPVGGAFYNYNKNLFYTGGQETQIGIGKIFFRIISNNDNKLFIEEIPNMNYSHFNHSIIANNGFLFVIGGFYNNKCEYFNFSSFKWEEMQEINEKEMQKPMLFL